ncbi:DUF2927 domain-containing protein [Mesobacterium sp. TK19101]|uniref:DUF2927 domain-containing protein n=1 Tax=Mesobacterium hydrothermale TaxID=3111907 RepID=A0ABU6HDZ2_9RHOB|nr:DUF2927 domain-containing protein [Mesobacterium sp. TK19101]MEC3860596.1 DUF2927 domain-containing protein [Mesobacterium sp. TK19101]
MRALVLTAILLLASCAPAPDGAGLPLKVNSVTPKTTPLPPMKRFSAAPPPSGPLSNADLARDFLDLTFELESGRKIERLTRVDGPIRLRVAGPAPALLVTELRDLIGRLRSEAGLDIALTDGPAQITVNAISRAQVRRSLPQAACFVIPGVSDWTEFQTARRSGALDWTRLTKRDKLAIFVPHDVAPQELRDCLHEELAQALGPVNDLYRLPDSVFNDDNVHTVLTAHDMMILRLTYAPELSNGMSRAEVAARLPRILARINPGGARIPAHGQQDTPRAWIDAIQTALGPGTSDAGRKSAAERALRIARDAGITDHRLGFSHYILGRLNQGNRDFARAEFRAADAIFARSPSTRLHRAFTAAQLAADDIRRNAPQAALDRLAPYPEVAMAAQNAALLATLMLLQAEALDHLGQTDAAARLRLDSLGWARYGFGAESAVRGKADEVAALHVETAS